MSPKTVAIPITITVTPELIQTIGAIRDELWRALQSLDEMRVKHDHFYGRVRGLHEHLKEMFEHETVTVPEPAPIAPWANNPQAVEIDQVIRVAETLLRTESVCLRNVWLSWRIKTGSSSHDRAWSAVCNAAKNARRSDEFLKAREAGYAAGGAPAQDAAVALVGRDLIDEATDWDRDAYDYLTYSWAAVIGPAHPDDVMVIA